jgi:hypothetical protein
MLAVRVDSVGLGVLQLKLQRIQQAYLFTRDSAVIDATA